MSALGGHAALALSYLSAPTPSPSPSQSGGDPQAGPTALVIILLLVLAVIFLARSLMKHLNRVPASFDTPDAGPRDHRPRPPGHEVDSAPVTKPTRPDDE